METAEKTRLTWYRCPVSREDLRSLNQRSNFKGFAQTLGYLGVLALTGGAAAFSAGRVHWVWTVLLLLLHGTGWNFLINGFHELVHDSVFRTRFLNAFFLRIFSFLGWYNHHLFWASHTEHHKYTLHPPDDSEVLLPVKHSLKSFLLSAILNVPLIYGTLKTTLRHACGRLTDKWEIALYPSAQAAEKRKMVNWARILLVGHAALIAVSLYLHWWMLPLVITASPFYGGWLHYLCNNTQHTGLKDNVPDFRLCCRTITLNPLFQFLYWHMNYHTEHHMYAAVPCYNLRRLHRLIEPDLPHCPHGLWETWIHIAAILERQKQNPKYQFAAELPPGKNVA